MSDEYPAFTIADMARIPLEALPRFVAELPALIAIARPIVAMLDEHRLAGAEVSAQDVRDAFKSIVWVDDDKGVADINIVGPGENRASIRLDIGGTAK